MHIFLTKNRKINTMELFYFVRKCFKNLGVVPIQSEHDSSFNFKNLFVLISLLQMFISSLVYFLLEAKSIGELANSFYMILSCLACVIFFSISIWNISNILKLIGEFELFIEKSKLKISNKHMNYLYSAEMPYWIYLKT